MNRTKRYLQLALILSLCSVIQCTTADEENGDALATLPVWTANHELSITEPDGILFGRLFILDLTADRTVIVYDHSENHFLEFSEDGSFLGTISREGSGPGEIGGLGSFHVSPNNEIVAYDRENMRFMTFTGENGQWDAIRTQSIEQSETSFSRIFAGPDPDTYFAMASIIFRSSIADDNERQQVVHLINSSGRVLSDSLAVSPIDNFLIRRSNNGGFSVRIIPGRVGLDSYFAVAGRRYVISARNDDFRFSVYDHQTGEKRTILHPVPRRALTGAEQQELLKEAGSGFRSEMREKMPEYHPVLQQILTDDEQRIWARIHTGDGEENSPNWVIINLDGTLEGKLYLPGHLNVRQVHNRRIYAISSPDDDAPSIEVFSFSPS